MEEIRDAHNTLLYSVCYYYSKDKKENILKHLTQFRKIMHGNDVFVLSVMVDSDEGDVHSRVKNEISDFVKSSSGIEHVVLTCPNWGGTILGLWMAYQYGKRHNKDAYVAHFEEDFVPISSDWYSDSLKLLDTGEYIYIGEHIPSTSNPEQNYENTKRVEGVDNRVLRQEGTSACFNDIYKQHGCYVVESRWTDGGYYFTSIANLQRIDEKIGMFHKGDPQTKYNHAIDGIILGEVGFPSQVGVHFKFVGLLRSKYFVHC